MSGEVEALESTYTTKERLDEDIVKILVATDIHLGFNEKDPLRGNDSFNTFEEILQHAVKNEVDFILLGGDLFHESKPSTICYHRCISLLKKYCLGDKPVSIEFLSDQSRNFGHLKNPIVNYEDPNLNVSIPVFSIHGNHDDPTGENHLSAMDILADTGLVNYFGKWTDLTQIEIYPLLMKKGITHFALYGLSHIKDERLSRLFRDKKVSMIRPSDSDNWFNMLVLHQNRAQNRGIKNYIPETVLPEFLNLVIWGHEHDCRLAPETSPNGVYISQPGSSVATSLALGESITKYVGLLKVHENQFTLDQIKLNTVRPFIFKEVMITKPEGILNVPAIEYAKAQIEEIIETMLKDVKEIVTPESPTPPLLRLVVNFSEESLIGNSIRMGQQYADRVANPVDMLAYKMKKSITYRKNAKDDIKDLDEITGEHLAEGVQDLVDKYFEAKKQSLKVLSTKGLCEAVSRYIDRNDTDALDDIFKHQYNKILDKLLDTEEEIDEDNIDQYLEQFRQERLNRPADELTELSQMLDNVNRKVRQVEMSVNISDDDDSSDVTLNNGTTASTSSLRGAPVSRPARGRGSRGPRKTRARGKAI